MTVWISNREKAIEDFLYDLTNKYYKVEFGIKININNKVIPFCVRNEQNKIVYWTDWGEDFLDENINAYEIAYKIYKYLKEQEKNKKYYEKMENKWKRYNKFEYYYGRLNYNHRPKRLKKKKRRVVND